MPAGKSTARLTAGMILQQAARYGSSKLEDSKALVLPVAFAARWDENEDCADVWQDVWTELGASESYVLSQHGDAVVAPLIDGLKVCHLRPRR